MTTTPITLHRESDLRLHFDLDGVGKPRLTLDFGFASIAAVGIEDVEDLIEGFQLRDETRVSCRRYAYALEEHEDEGGKSLVAYHDKRGEVWMTRRDYDHVAGMICELLADLRVRSTFETVYARLIGTRGSTSPGNPAPEEPGA